MAKVNPNENVETTKRPRREVKKPDKWSYDPEWKESNFAYSWTYGIFLEKAAQGRNWQGQVPEEQRVW